MKREEMEKARKHMTSKEIERMGERQSAIDRDRYKSDEVVAEREAELWDEFRQIQLRVDRRIPLWEAEQRRSAELAKEAQEVFDDDAAEEADKALALRKVLHDPFKDLDAHLTDAEMHELNELKAHPDTTSNPAIMQKLQGLLAVATERRIEEKIDEMLEREDDVLV